MKDEMIIMPAGAEMETLGLALAQVLGPLAEMVAHNTQAMEQVAAVQRVQNARMEELEHRARLQTKVNTTQVRYLNEAIRRRAEAALFKMMTEVNSFVNPTTIRKVSTAIRRDVLIRYGIAALAELPAHEYSVALSQIEIWNDVLIMHKVYMEWSRGHEQDASAQPAGDAGAV